MTLRLNRATMKVEWKRVKDIMALGVSGPAGTVTPATAVGDANNLDDIVEDFNALLANLRDAGILER